MFNVFIFVTGSDLQEITLATKMSSSPFEKLSDEIILKILSFLSLKTLGNCNRVSRKMKRIAEDTSLWEKVEAWLKVIPAGFMEKIVKSKVKYLSVQNCEVFPINLKFLTEHNLDLKFMDISICDGNDNFLSELVRYSKSLEYLNLHETRPNLVFKCIENFAYANKLKVLCVNDVKLNFKYVKKIIDKCTELTDLDISAASLTQQSIVYICTNLTPNALRVDLSYNKVKDKHIQLLVEHCNNLEHLDLIDTKVTYKSVTRIVMALSHSLVTLALPDNVGIEIGLPSNICMEKLKVFSDLTKLENLHIGSDIEYLRIPNIDGGIDSDDSHIAILKKYFPKLNIGRGLGELGTPEWETLNTEPYRFFYEQNFKRVDCFPQNLPRRSNFAE